MYKLLCSIIFVSCALTLSAQRVEIQEPCNIHEKADPTSKKLLKLDILDDVTIVAKGSLDIVNSKSDYWYAVEKIIYDEETWEEINTIEGFVFGHFTSYKAEGQRTQTLVFNGCELGDCYHLIFGENDFGGANNVFEFPEEICLDEEEGITGNPDYMGKKMILTINDLYTWDYEYCNPDSEPEMIKTPTIVYLTLAETGTATPMNHTKPKCATVEDSSGEDYGQDPTITTTCTYKNIKVVSIGYADYTGKYSYQDELYVSKGDHYEPIKLSALLNENQGRLLEILQAGAENQFNSFLEDQGVTDCIEFTSLPTLKIDDFSLGLDDNSISFIYNLDVTSDWACGPYTYVIVDLKITEFDRYLK